MRTCDIEAAMAHAMSVMADFSKVAGRPNNAVGRKWLRQGYLYGWYRDFLTRVTISRLLLKTTLML